MRFHVLAVLSREPDGQTFQNRCIAEITISVEELDDLGEKIADWLRDIFHEERTSTKLIAISHAQVI